MTNVDQKFADDVGECLTIATRLSKLETEESKAFVAEQLRILSDFIQKKQKDAEARIDEEIAEEEKEIQILKDRIEKASSSADGPADIETIDVLKMWTTLKETYWSNAFEVYISDTKEPVKMVLDNLMKILKTSFEVSKSKARQSRDDIIFQIIQPGVERTTQKMPKEVDQNLIDLCTKCQADCMPFCLEPAKNELFDVAKRHRDIKAFFETQSQELNKTLHLYLEKCVEFCWVACFQEPELLIVSTPNKECKHIANQFQGLDKVTHAIHKTHVEWPALVQGDKVKVPWELYDLSGDRPVVSRKEKETGTKYRTVKTEDAHGNDIPDEEESTRMAIPNKQFKGQKTTLNTSTGDGVTATSGETKMAERGEAKPKADGAVNAKGTSGNKANKNKPITKGKGTYVSKTPESNLNRRNHQNYQQRNQKSGRESLDF